MAHLPKILSDCVSKVNWDIAKAKEAISHSFIECEEKLTASGIPVEESGAAVVVCIVSGDELLVATAGDAVCVAGCVHEEHWYAMQLSVDCKPASEVTRLRECGGVLTHDGV